MLLRAGKTFQLTPSRRATTLTYTALCGIIFQLTPSRRATALCAYPCAKFTYFNSRPHGGRRLLPHLFYPIYHFNSRPHGGRRKFPVNVRLCKYFNSRPHGGRRGGSGGSGCPVDISTHALTEGDIRMIRSCDFPVISTHALTEGDGIPERNSKPALEFQLTPSRRATFSAIVSLSFSAYFNSRPHGGRRQCVYICAVTVYFNSRPHGGRPRTGVISGDSTAISTHALTEGDLSPFTYCPLSMLFQLTPSRRATFAPFFLSFKNKDFNSRPHGGRRYLRAATVS